MKKDPQRWIIQLKKKDCPSLNASFYILPVLENKPSKDQIIEKVCKVRILDESGLSIKTKDKSPFLLEKYNTQIIKSKHSYNYRITTKVRGIAYSGFIFRNGYEMKEKEIFF